MHGFRTNLRTNKFSENCFIFPNAVSFLFCCCCLLLLLLPLALLLPPALLLLQSLFLPFWCPMTPPTPSEQCHSVGSSPRSVAVLLLLKVGQSNSRDRSREPEASGRCCANSGDCARCKCEFLWKEFQWKCFILIAHLFLRTTKYVPISAKSAMPTTKKIVIYSYKHKIPKWDPPESASLLAKARFHLCS